MLKSRPKKYHMFTTYKIRLCKNWLMNWTIDKCHIIFFLNKKIHALKYGKIDWELVDCSSRQSLHYLFKKKHKRCIIPLKKVYYCIWEIALQRGLGNDLITVLMMAAPSSISSVCHSFWITIFQMCQTFSL